jgi:hypothetical protein
MKKPLAAFFSAFTFCSFVLLPGFAQADGKISFRLQGGWAYLSAGDVNPGTQSFFDHYEALWPASIDGYLAVHKGYEFGGDVIFELTPRLGVGIGGGYLQISRASAMQLFDPELVSPYARVVVEPRMNAAPVRMSVHLTVPLSTRLSFHSDVGASYYFRARYSDEWWRIIMTFDEPTSITYISNHVEKKGIPIGFHGGVGLEYELKHNFFLYLDARGRYARFRGWKGTSVLEIDNETFSEQGILYYESVPMLTGSPRLIMVQSDPPDGPDGEPRQAVVDFSGVSLQIGIRIRL